MSREYILTYTHKDSATTLHLNQIEMDNILAIGDTHPLQGKPSSCTVEVEGKPDNRFWWRNNPLPKEQVEYLTNSALTVLLKPTFS